MELLLAVSVVALLSVAVAGMLAGAARTSTYVTTTTDAMSQVETAYRRLVHNVRTASAITAPAAGATDSTLTLQTQPDGANSNVPWTVTLKVVNGNLVEDDGRYDGSSGTPNVLVPNVKVFTVSRSAGSSPTTITVTITSNTAQAVTRTATIACRNF
jgi:type II secretory pathway component PulJ